MKNRVNVYDILVFYFFFIVKSLMAFDVP